MKLKHYILIIVLGFINAFVSQFLSLGLGIFLIFGNVVDIGLFSITSVHLYFILIEIILMSLLVAKFLAKNTLVSFQKRFVTIVIIFFLCQLVSVALPALYSQKKYESKHPIVTEEKKYNFTKPFSITERPVVSLHHDFKDNKIIWVEQTKKFPVYPNNIWDVLLFTFDPSSGQGATTNITNLKKNSVDTAVIGDDALYWTEGDENFKYNLYSYNINTKEKKKITDDTEYIYGIYKNKLLVDGMGMGNYPIFVVDVETGSKKPIQFTRNPPGRAIGPKVFGQYAVYINGDELWMYDIGNDTFTNKEIIPDPDLRVEYEQPYVFGFGDIWVGYKINKLGTLRIYNRLTKEVINLDQDVPHDGGSVKFVDMYPKPILKDSLLFYVKNTSLVRLNLDTKKEDVLISDFTPKNTEFDIEGNYMLRFMKTPDDEFGGQQEELYLYPLLSNQM